MLNTFNESGDRIASSKFKSAKYGSSPTQRNYKSFYNSSLKLQQTTNTLQRNAKYSQRSLFVSCSSSFRENHAFEKRDSSYRNATSFNVWNNSLMRSSQPVDLVVTNLDPNMDHISLKKELVNFFRNNNIHVIHVCVLTPQHYQHSNSMNGCESPPSYSLKAIVKVATSQDAQIAVSRLHRHKFGSKRILISNLSNDRSPPLHVLKTEVMAIFEDIPSKKLPLVTFQDMYEKRYNRSICMSDIHKLREVIQVTNESEIGGGRYVVVNPYLKYKKVTNNNEQVAVDLPYCTIHTSKTKNDAWIEQEQTISLPSVNISLKTLAAQIHKLLDTHGGSFPLNSIVDCYLSEFERELVYEEPCVPLEHLISCLPGIEVCCFRNLGFKRVQWSENKLEEDQIAQNDLRLNPSNSASDAIAKQLNQFSREVKDLLKSQPHSLISFSKFVPAYHNHFGRQCCVYQYGYTKLIDLLEAVSHVVQILGDGTKRMLTLTHREQTKRFAADLLKVLKVQPGKRLTLKQFPELFETVLEKSFDVADYGVCCVTDILQDVWEGTVVMRQEDDDIVVEIPKREQTEEEKKRTKLFSKDVIELLQSTPNFAMAFCKFIPAYHHYFSRQCKVSDYGFSKLIELLEEITPDVIELLVSSNGEDKFIRLNFENRLRAIGYRLMRIIKSHCNGCILLNQLQNLFRYEYGFGINFEDFDAHDMLSLIKKMPATFNVIVNDDECSVKLVDDTMSDIVRRRVLRILMEEEDGEKQTHDLLTVYKNRYDQELDVFVLYEKMTDCIEIQAKSKCITLTSTQLFIRDCILVIQSTSLYHLNLRELSEVYTEKFQRSLPLPKEFGYKTLLDLFQSQSDFISVRKNGETSWLLNLDDELIDDKLIISSITETSETNEIIHNGYSSDSTIEKDSSEEIHENGYVTNSSEPGSSNSSNVPFPPEEWLAEKNTGYRKPRRIAANFDLYSENDR